MRSRTGGMHAHAATALHRHASLPMSLRQDPLADGATIHSAATRALGRGTTLDAVISMVSSVSPSLSAPLVLFTYYNPIIRRGMDTFCEQIKAAGASGAPQQAVRCMLGRSSSVQKQ